MSTRRTRRRHITPIDEVVNASEPKIHAAGERYVSLTKSPPHWLKPARSTMMAATAPVGTATACDAIAATAKRRVVSRTSAGTAKTSSARDEYTIPATCELVRPAVSREAMCSSPANP